LVASVAQLVEQLTLKIQWVLLFRLLWVSLNFGFHQFFQCVLEFFPVFIDDARKEQN